MINKNTNRLAPLTAIASKIVMCVPIIFFIVWFKIPFRPFGLISADTHPQTVASVFEDTNQQPYSIR